MEIESRIYAVDWSSLERIAKFFKVEHEDKSKLAVAKHVVQRLEEELEKLKEEKIVPYLKDVKKLLTEKPSSGIKGEGKGEKEFSVILNLPRYQRKIRFINCCQLALHADSLRLMDRLGSPSKRIKSVFHS